MLPRMAPEGTTVVGRAGWRTRANALTSLRAVLAPPLVFAIVTHRPALATGIFCLAVATDLADGPIARRYGETSPLGGLLDHGVDATFCVLGLAALAGIGLVPWPLPLLVAIAFLQYTLDSRGHQGKPLVGSRLGRWNGIAYYVLVAVPIVRDTLGWSFPNPLAVWMLGVALTVSTVLSMLSRLSARFGGS